MALHLRSMFPLQRWPGCTKSLYAKRQIIYWFRLVSRMKIVLLIMLVLIAFSLTASAEPVAIGGDFGRAWISNYLAKNPSPFTQDNNSSSGNWGNAPKAQGT